MPYRLLAFDMDDTLLTDDLTISLRTVKAVRAAAERGVKVVLSTGRMHRSALPYMRMLALDGPVISANGAMVRDSADDTIFRHVTLPMEIAQEVAAWCDRENLYLQVYLRDDYYFRKACFYSRMYAQRTGVEGIEAGPLSAFLKEEPTKMIIINEPDMIETLNRDCLDRYGDRLYITISKSMYLEFLHKEATKGNALRYLAESYGIPREEVLAVGDSLNDLSMIEYAGLGLAVRNGRPEVLKAADAVIDGNMEDGVAKAIETYVLGG